MIIMAGRIAMQENGARRGLPHLARKCRISVVLDRFSMCRYVPVPCAWRKGFVNVSPQRGLELDLITGGKAAISSLSASNIVGVRCQPTHSGGSTFSQPATL